MSKNIDRNLEIISNIDEDIIDRNTEKRINYINSPRNSKKKIIPIIVIAAAVAVIVSIALFVLAPMLIPGDVPGPGTEPYPGTDPHPGQVPIYTGMTVSSADGSQIARVDGVVSLSSIILIDNENTSGNNGGHGAAVWRAVCLHTEERQALF